MTTDWILAGFSGAKQEAQQRYSQFVNSGKGQPSPWQQLKNQIYLGADRDEGIARAYLSGHYTLTEVGSHFHVSYATVSRAVKVFERKNVNCKA